ncbi:hypothetical protein J5N97_025977 [Dioscorea zingiberensis]|uniref:Uncharacterized protein n=1 Tax=Dioscorea zingiberensis TaxID=325984 RepID=A0A9D5C2K6_9LILI|nr:hypothetical protein J5N97_025977 [Dioscorea zingiberensis]
MTSMGETAVLNVERAEEIKLLANEAFKANKFSQAIELYSQAIEHNGLNAVYWANRAFAHTKLEEYGSAVQDATKAIEIDPKYSKVKRISPNDPDATKKLKECEKLFRSFDLKKLLPYMSPKHAQLQTL